MIDLTPLDVRKKRGDFARALRGYDPAVVDSFLDLVADRLEELVRENAGLRERNVQILESLSTYRAREQAMNDALLMAQQLREEMREQAAREGEMALREARAEGERILAEARRQAAAVVESTRRVHGQRARYLRTFRALVERQLAEIEMEEERGREALQAEGRPETAEPADAHARPGES